MPSIIIRDDLQLYAAPGTTITTDSTINKETIMTADVRKDISDGSHKDISNEDQSIREIPELNKTPPRTPVTKKPTTTILNTPENPCQKGDHHWELVHNPSWVKQDLLRGVCLGEETCGKKFVVKIMNPATDCKPAEKNPVNMCTVCKRGICHGCWVKMQQNITRTKRNGQGQEIK